MGDCVQDSAGGKSENMYFTGLLLMNEKSKYRKHPLLNVSQFTPDSHYPPVRRLPEIS